MVNIYKSIDVSSEAINRPLPIERRRVLYKIQSLVRDKLNTFCILFTVRKRYDWLSVTGKVPSLAITK